MHSPHFSFTPSFVCLKHFKVKTINTGLAVKKTLLFVILFLGILAAFWQGPLFAQNLESLKKGVVKVKGKEKAGSGFIISISEKTIFVLTAAHVVAGAKNPQIEFFTNRGREFHAAIVEGSELDDDYWGLALLRVDKTNDVPSDIIALSLESKQIQASSEKKVAIIGLPRGVGDWAIIYGRIISRRGRGLHIDANIQEGASGGPVLRDQIVTGLVQSRDSNYLSANPADSILSFLQGFEITIDLVNPPKDNQKELQIVDRTSPPPFPKNPPPMIRISSGEFWMGSSEGDGDPDEHPRNKVYLDAFYMDMYEVTVSHYAKFMNTTGRNDPAFWVQMDLRRDGEKPVVGISWYDARDYCEWTGKRLPTEAEWERTARGKEGRKYPWGSNPPSSKLANFDQDFRPENAYIDYLKPVGTYENAKTPEGAYDMTGNVWEWVNDWYDQNYYQHIPPRNPKGPDNGKTKVLRGGSWDYFPWILRPADRDGRNPSERHATVGFRCARQGEKP